MVEIGFEATVVEPSALLAAVILIADVEQGQVDIANEADQAFLKDARIVLGQIGSIGNGLLPPLPDHQPGQGEDEQAGDGGGQPHPERRSSGLRGSIPVWIDDMRPRDLVLRSGRRRFLADVLHRIVYPCQFRQTCPPRGVSFVIAPIRGIVGMTVG